MRRLFIQDSESPRTLRQLAVLVGMVMVALVISDWLLGRVLPHITTEPPFILRPVNVPGVEALWRYSEAGLKPIIFTGSSQTYTGISPHEFDNQIKAISGQDVRSVNISIFGSVVTIQRDLIRNLFIPNHPQVILYGIEMRALRTVSVQDEFISVDDFKHKPLGYAVSKASSIERDVLLWLLQYSSLVGYRDNFRNWLTGKDGMNEVVFLHAPVDDVGYAPYPNTFSTTPTFIQNQFLPFEANDTARQKLGDISVDCKQSGVQCILINMPIHALAYDYIGEKEEAAYWQMLRETQLPIWDFNTYLCRTIFGDQSFYNLNHLSAKGAVRFSQMIADVYANAFYDVPLESDAKCMTILP